MNKKNANKIALPAVIAGSFIITMASTYLGKGDVLIWTFASTFFTVLWLFGEGAKQCKLLKAHFEPPQPRRRNAKKVKVVGKQPSDLTGADA